MYLEEEKTIWAQVYSQDENPVNYNISYITTQQFDSRNIRTIYRT